MFKLTSIKSGFAENGSIRTTISRNYRGILVCIFGGMASMWLSEHYATPVMLIALLLGLAMNFLNDDVRIRPGILWVAKGLLRIGVGLLGLRILFTQIVAEGIAGPAIVITAMLMTFLTGALIAKLMNLNSSFARLSAGSVAVCGVSAAIAISAVLPKRKNADNELAVVIITVTVLSTLAMIIYPIIAKQLAFDDTAAGIFMGGSIHDVAQVVGAGFSISETAGDTATYIKLMRVALLLPIVLIIGLLSRGETDLADRPPLLPGFLIGFLVLAGLNSFSLIPTEVAAIGNNLSRTFLVLSIFAIGVKSKLSEIFTVGWTPLLLICAETLMMAMVVVAGLLIL